MTIWQIKGTTIGTIVIGFTEEFEGTFEEAEQYVYDNRPLEDWIKEACNLVNTNYNTYCEQGLSYTNVIEYIILNNKLTRDEVDKKIININFDFDTCFNWTMDSPRTKFDLTDKATTLTFLESVQSVILSNEELLRDKKTTIDGMDLATVQAFIETPTYPTYGRTV